MKITNPTKKVQQKIQRIRWGLKPSSESDNWIHDISDDEFASIFGPSTWVST